MALRSATRWNEIRAALTDVALGIGTGAEIQAALARVVIGGLLASTLVTLILIPVTYTTVTEWMARMRADRRWKKADEETEEQAATA